MTVTKQIYSLEDLYAQRFAPISTLDLSRVSATVKAYAQFLADDMSEQLNMFTEETTLSRSIWGGAPAMAFDEVGEFGRGTPRKDTAGQEVHFPLFKLSASQGASDEFWKRANVKDLVDTMTAMDIGYATRVRQEISAAIFNNTLHTKVTDWLIDNSTLNKIQPFLNADSAAIPPAPNGTTFTASTHNHYLGTATGSFVAADMNGIISTVTEHVVGEVAVFVDAAMPATLSGLASTKFVALTPTVIVNQTASQVAREAFDPNADRGNMLVGYWDGYKVYTRSWVPTGYIAVLAVGGQLGKPLLHRVDPQFPGLLTGLEIRDGVLSIKESYFYAGFGVFNRAGGAILNTTAQSPYTVPSGLVRK